MSELSEKRQLAVKIGLLCAACAALVFSFLELRLPTSALSGPGGVSVPDLDAAWIAIALCGIPIVCGAIAGLVTAFDIKADVLVSIALAASVIIGEYFAAGEVALIMQLGSLLEEITVGRARAGIEKLVRLTPRTARILKDGAESIVRAEDVCQGDLLRVLPGETIAADGIVVAGSTSVSEAVMTGEPLPVGKSAGDSVLSGTVNGEGAFDMKALKAGEDSSFQRMVKLVQTADAGKAKIVRLADRWATWIVAGALAAAEIAWWATGDIIRAVTVLVVFCPCSLVLATPTAITAAIGNASRHHFLVREGGALERLAEVEQIAFDKTGTLTFGVPSVAKVETLGSLSRERLYALAAAAESRSEHPLGKAVASQFAKGGGVLPSVESFKALPGRGVEARIEGEDVLVGTGRLLAERGLELDAGARGLAEPWLQQGCSVVWLAVRGALAGFIALADTLRPDASKMIASLKDAGVSPVLLTGDQENAARAAAEEAGIGDVHCRCLPEDKLGYIEDCRNNYVKVCMIGDGINDAPALKASHVGIAMGGIGSDVACDASDIVLVKDDIAELPHLVSLARRTMRVIKANLSFSMLLNFAAITLAILGILNPVTGALVHNAGSVFVIVNSAFLLAWKPVHAQGGGRSPAAVPAGSL